MLAELGHPERHFAAVHVGGTNGKGSVATLTAAALEAAGHSVGLYTSPHLVDIRERMVVDGRPISPDAFVMWTERLRNTVEQVDASFFEATTAIAFADFAARGVDVGVVEVGLGGRLDATNVLTPVASAVTRVRLEHTDYLGHDPAGIAREKAGIAKPGVPFVIGESDPVLAAVLEETALAAGAVPRRLAPEIRYEGSLALAGGYQRRNAAVAQALLESLPGWLRPPAGAIADAFATTVLPGRFDRRGIWLFDVAHNPDGVDTLLETLRSVGVRRPLHAIVAILGDKDWRVMLDRLLAVADGVWVTDAPSAPPERRWRLGAVREAFGERIRVEPDLARAMAEAPAGAGTVLVTGSFHTVGDVMARLPGFAPAG